MTNVDYTDDQVFLTNTPAQAESLLHSLEQAARVIGLYLNANKTEFMCFKQKGVMSTKCHVMAHGDEEVGTIPPPPR